MNKKVTLRNFMNKRWLWGNLWTKGNCKEFYEQKGNVKEFYEQKGNFKEFYERKVTLRNFMNER